MEYRNKYTKAVILLFTAAIFFTYVYFSSAQSAVGKSDKPRIEVGQAVTVSLRGSVVEDFSRQVAETASVKEPTPIQTSVKDRKHEVRKKKVENKELTILAVGDDLIHTQVIRSGLKSNGKYNFDHLFDGIRSDLQNADVAIINQETILCGKKRGYSGYPAFGSPYAIGTAIHKAGFDVVLHATNHTLDKGVGGIEDTQNFWDRYNDIVVAGINKTDDPAERISYITKNGITLAILNYTYGLNGLRLPKGKEYMINLLTDKEQMKRDIKLAKRHSDFVIAAPHWGTEYVYKPTDGQEELTEFFCEQGVDLVIGTHPHVLEPIEWIESEDGSHRMLVYYSLGNFISNQDAMARMLGGMAKIKLVAQDGKVVIDEASIEPLVTHTFYDGRQRFVTYRLKDYDRALAAKHYLNRKKKNALTLSRLQSLSNEILSDWYDITG